jgi:NAD(P)-dependent dehydrogenase (short-subunit alcohol dehydrogenase family)
MKDVEGKVAFITGGASGMGFGMARAFLAAGMKVIIADFSRPNLDDARGQLKGSNAAHFIEVDVSDRAAMARAADEAESVFGKVHVLCNNAGIGGGPSIDDGEFEEWDWMMAVNLGGVVNGVKTFIPRIRAHGEGGHVMATSSMAGMTPLAGRGGCYTTAKFAVRGLMESLRMTLAPDNIGTSLLCPGFVNTQIFLDQPQPGRPENWNHGGMRQELIDLLPGAMDPLVIGERVLDAIQRNQFYILPHAEFKPEMEELHREIIDAFPTDLEITKERAEFEKARWAESRRLKDLMPRG